jgi:hypothetical protein
MSPATPVIGPAPPNLSKNATGASTTLVPPTQTGGPEGPPVADGHDPLAGTDDYRSSDRTDCGAWLACESMLVPACCRICDFVNSTISSAMSTSRIRLSAEIRFS